MRPAMVMIPLLVMKAAEADPAARARANAKRFDAAASACDRLLHAWLKHADPRTLLLPDRVPGRRLAAVDRDVPIVAEEDGEGASTHEA